jgi:hypothetical protein
MQRITLYLDAKMFSIGAPKGTRTSSKSSIHADLREPHCNHRRSGFSAALNNKVR